MSDRMMLRVLEGDAEKGDGVWLREVPVQLPLAVVLMDWVGPVLDLVDTKVNVSVGLELKDGDSLQEEGVPAVGVGVKDAGLYDCVETLGEQVIDRSEALGDRLGEPEPADPLWLCVGVGEEDQVGLHEGVAVALKLREFEGSLGLALAVDCVRDPVGVLARLGRDCVGDRE